VNRPTGCPPGIFTKGYIGALVRALAPARAPHRDRGSEPAFSRFTSPEARASDDFFEKSTAQIWYWIQTVKVVRMTPQSPDD
jgi:hypothetical protein